MAASSVTEGKLGVPAIDLSTLSVSNYARHRLLRWFCLFVTVAVEVPIIYLAWQVGATGDPIAYVALPASALVAFLVLSMGAYGFRFLAPPPAFLTIGNEGLEFRLPSGGLRFVAWNDHDLEMEILDRSSDSTVGQLARFRVWVRGSPSDRRLPWRRVVPLAYVTKEIVERIIRSAESKGVFLDEDRGYNPISMTLLRSSTAVGFTIKAGTFRRSTP
jgi:hypothetical protein